MIIWICQCSNNTWKCQQEFMEDLAQNVIHDKKRLDDISLSEFLIYQCSKNTWKCEQGVITDLVQNVIHDNKRFDDILLLESLIC